MVILRLTSEPHLPTGADHRQSDAPRHPDQTPPNTGRVTKSRLIVDIIDVVIIAAAVAPGLDQTKLEWSSGVTNS